MNTAECDNCSELKLQSELVEHNGREFCRFCFDRYFAKQPSTDIINEPPHYTKGGIETIDFIKAKLSPVQYKGHLIANILKYITRHEHKNGVEDLKKAQWYLDRLIKEYEG